jgi:Fuc2NAc and GlcNAc transferase
VTLVGIAVLAFVLAALGTGLFRRLAFRWNLMDIPNARSSHQTVTPRGGGVAIVLAFAVAVVLLWNANLLDRALLNALAGAGLIALAGFLDDRYGLSVVARLLAQLAAALWAIWCLGGLPGLLFGDSLVTLGWWGYLLGAVTIVWSINLFNFMDGIDGIAAAEAACVSFAGSALALMSGSIAVASVGFAFGWACCGFLPWNWPPAKIFMGDVASGFIGYVLAVLAIAAARETPSAPWAWLMLGGVFFVDATVTLLRRMARGERVFEAHRTHAYQWLARRWRSHARVTAAVIGVNLLWLTPCALLASFYPRASGWLLLVALSSLVGLAVAAGSGRSETGVPS